MKLIISNTKEELGKASAIHAAKLISEAIAKQGYARILLSTGASQFPFFEEFVKQDIEWGKVEMFHLDEYVDLPITHVASFRKYLQERFVDKVGTLKAVHFVDGTREGIEALTREIRRAPVDIGLIGIGENAHIAFNDPPADFDTKEAYIVVNLNERCKQQQMGEGWFATIDDVPKQAVSMTAYQIMQCKTIVSCVPHKVKAEAIRKTLAAEEVTNEIPATLLKTHPDFILYLDENSASEINA